MAAPVEEYLDYACKNTKNQSSQDQIFLSPLAVSHVLKTWLTLDASIPSAQILSSGSSGGIFLDGERWGSSVLINQGPELDSLGSVDSRPKAPRELLGTCEGPSSVTWLGPFFCHRQEGTIGGTFCFHHTCLGCSGQCFCKVSAHFLNF